MAKTTFKFAIGSQAYCLTKEEGDDGATMINIRNVKIDSVHADSTIELYTVVDSDNDVTDTVPKSRLFEDKEALYKAIDKIYNI